ncbi:MULTISPECIES: response regulator transcription factor [Actinomycetaceae]|uniref:response regulator transcription factor n=1 Tax=Actinomycetaceae TaxID=2049 RepID=UPI000396C212|nr:MULTISPECIES: response regulator transcription factor [Actinomycetaceae]ERH29786.1 response regulator receiver domain protein [Actinomyces sp. oral taxon 172 str. F0311]WLD78192.1 response regulator transcription factor [Schaalia sp. HMT-172]
MTIRVLVADDQAMIRGALAGLLDLERDIEVVAQAADGAQALDELARLASADAPAHAPARASAPVDVAIIDVEMPRMDGITATQAIRERFPGVRVLIVTTFGRPGYLQRALDAGATGFTVKDAPVETLAEGVRTVAAGGRVIDQNLALEALAAGSSPLTDREADVLREVEGGGTIADIAHSLHLSQGTVRNHVSSSMLKMDARTRAEAASLARAAGWL